jgi:hypothetical protein
VPFLADLLRSDSIYIGSNITFGNLAPLSTFLGKPGDTAKGGLPIEEYMRRQDLHRRAEINALLDTPSFISPRADILWLPPFGLRHRRLDLRGGGPRRSRRSGAASAFAHTLMVWIEGTEASRPTELIRRFDRAPKPMYYQPDVLSALWQATWTPAWPRMRSTPTPSCASPMPARWPIARRFTRRWRELGRQRHRRGRKRGARRRRCRRAGRRAPLAASPKRLGRAAQAEATRSHAHQACPPTLPAFDVLRDEGVMVMGRGRADRQDIRPLRIGLLNLMPKKIQTETQFARLIGATPLQVEFASSA